MSIHTTTPTDVRKTVEQEQVVQTDSAGTTINRLTYQMGFWSALIALLGGLLYLVSILWNIALGSPYPPIQSIRTLIGISVFVVAPGLLVLMACIHAYAPRHKKVLSQVAYTFTAVFAVLAIINRFLQVTVLMQPGGGPSLFDLYNLHSVALGLEMLSWGFCLGLATLFAAPVFAGGTFERWIRGLLIVNGVLCITSGLGYVLANQIDTANQMFSAVEMGLGILAWAVVLPLAAALLTVFFKHVESKAS